MLDILEDYCGWKGYNYCRLDGQTPHNERQVGKKPIKIKKKNSKKIQKKKFQKLWVEGVQLLST